MWSIIRKMLGLGPAADIPALVKGGATILDVRTREEYGQGHVEGSVNIPLDEIERRLREVDKLKSPLVTCCRSGARSNTAAKLLRKKGYEAYNGGGWETVASMK